ncbi:hypothetical protein BKA93DRAFT_518951 [Sparassis latifolia]
MIPTSQIPRYSERLRDYSPRRTRDASHLWVSHLHRISDKRIARTPLVNVRILMNLREPCVTWNAIIATTIRQGRVPSDLRRRREKEFQERWKPILNLGSATARFLGTLESAWSIIDRIPITGSMPSPLVLQEYTAERTRGGEIFIQ